jgi:Tfp pilus assembly protein PilF
MGLIVLKCPNCAGEIGIDENKEFGFCVHCGQKIMIRENIKQTVRSDNDHVIENWLTLAGSALRSNDHAAAEANADKVLEADLNNSQAWLFKGCAAALQKHITEAAHDWERSFSLVKDKDTAISNSDMVARYVSDYLKSMKADEVKGECAYVTRTISLATDPALGISPTHLPNKTLQLYLQKAKVRDLTDLFKTFIDVFNTGDELIWYETDPKVMLTRVGVLLDMCVKYQKMIKKCSLFNLRKMGQRTVDKASVEIRISGTVQRMEAMKEIFEERFSRLTDEENESLKEYWMQNKDERFSLAEPLGNVSTLYCEAVKTSSEHLREEADAIITEFASKIISH